MRSVHSENCVDLCKGRKNDEIKIIGNGGIIRQIAFDYNKMYIYHCLFG